MNLDISFDELLKEYERLAGEKVDAKGEGLSSQEWREKLKISYQKVFKFLKQGIKVGRFEHKKRKDMRINGTYYWNDVYVLKRKKSKKK